MAARLQAWCELMDRGADHALAQELEAVSNDLGFWEHEWPHLCRRAVLRNKPDALFVLCKLEAVAPLTAPPLPPDLLKKIYSQLREHPDAYKCWSLAGHAELASRLAQSPQHWPDAFQAALVRQEGWQRAYGLSQLEEALETTPWYRRARQNWLKTRRGREELLDVLGSLHGPWSTWDEILTNHWSALPPARRSEFAEALGQRLCALKVKDLTVLRQVARAYVVLADLGAPVATADWQAWWRVRLDEAREPLSVLQMLGLLRGAFAVSPARPPMGLCWCPETAYHWGRSLGGFLVSTPEATQVGLHPRHELASTGVFELERWLEAWGLETPTTQAAFDAGMAAANPRWEEVIQTPTPSLLASPLYEQARSEWKARRLARALLPYSSSPSRHRM